MDASMNLEKVVVEGKETEVCVVKKAAKSPLKDPAFFCPGSNEDVSKIVKEILSNCEKGREKRCLEYCQQFDKWPKDVETVLLTKEGIQRQIKDVSDQTKTDIQSQLKRVSDFAKLQKEHIKDFESTDDTGVTYGQRVIPVDCVGCYVPGGRYSHISSSIMTIATAKVAGVKTVIACSPPIVTPSGGKVSPFEGRMQPATLYAMVAAGADYILCIGGAHGIAALAYGLFTGVEADMIAGPGNIFVAEAKRFLYGKVGIDLFAGPTEILVLADKTADPNIIATDLVSQAEHGPTSPAWLISTDLELCKKVKNLCKEKSERLHEDQLKAGLGGNISIRSWEEWGEILFVSDKESMRRISDWYAPEHLEVQCREDELDSYWLKNLRNYGSLFLGEETCVTYGDKISGPNHALPTLRAARYTGGLSVDKYLKKLTYQKATRDANKDIGCVAARISRAEGMEGHARAADDRLFKYFPNQNFDLGIEK